MLALARGAFAAALVLLLSVPAIAADKQFQRDDLADAAIKLEAQIKADAGQVSETGRGAAPRGRCRVPAQRFPHRHADARSDRRWWRPTTAPTGCAWPRPSCSCAPATTASARCCSNARPPPPISPISARPIPPKRPKACVIIARTYADRSVWRPALDALRISLELREVADVRQQYEKLRDDHGFRLLDYTRRRRCRLAARLLPVLRGAARQAHRFLAVRGGRRPGQAGDLGAGQAALRRRASSTASATRSRCARACRRWSRRRWRRPPSSASMCATASRSCASPARPMCCRAPASAASRWSASTPRRWRSRSTGSATAICSAPWSATTSSATSTATTSTA